MNEVMGTCQLRLGQEAWMSYDLRNFHLMCYWLDGHPRDKQEPHWQWPDVMWAEVEP